MKKGLVHTPEIFGQFGELGLIPPATLGDVAAIQQQLALRLASFSQKAEEALLLTGHRQAEPATDYCPTPPQHNQPAAVPSLSSRMTSLSSVPATLGCR